MKRYIRSAENIDKKIKDYLAAWAQDNVKAGEPVASYRDFKEQMKAEGLKESQSRYDYYVECYNSANEKKSSKVKASTQYTDDADGWWYLARHGLGPGTIPRDVTMIDHKEDPENPWKDYICLDRFLTTQELKEYDLIEKMPPAEIKSASQIDNDEFFNWYDSLPGRLQNKVDDIADEWGLPYYEDCSDAELASLMEAINQ